MPQERSVAPEVAVRKRSFAHGFSFFLKRLEMADFQRCRNILQLKA
jgi:hypothetical protein